MGIETITILIVVAMIVLMLLGVPLGWVTMTLAVGCTLFWLGPNGLPLVASRVYGFVSEYIFVAVPLFVLMACILERSGVAQDLYRAMHIFAGGLPGGLAVQTTLVAVVMAAMTGIIGGEIVLLGLIALPQMLRLNYDPKLAIGTICAGGSLGHDDPAKRRVDLVRAHGQRVDQRSVPRRHHAGPAALRPLCRLHRLSLLAESGTRSAGAD